jgi:hypothetical protein
MGLAVSEHAFEPGEGARAANAVAQRPDAEVLLVAGAFDDEVAIAEQLLRRTWCAAAFVAAGVEEILGPLGERLEGIYGPCQWLAETAPEPEQDRISDGSALPTSAPPGLHLRIRRLPPTPPACSGSTAAAKRAPPSPTPWPPWPPDSTRLRCSEAFGFTRPRAYSTPIASASSDGDPDAGYR